jgi:hypothetical protein
MNQGGYNPETLRRVLDEAWNSLTPDEKASALKSDMALRILHLAQQGQRNPAKLRATAVIGVGATGGGDNRGPAPSIQRAPDRPQGTQSGG